MSHPEFIRKGFEANLAHFVEEAGEALSAAGKIQRFGARTANPLARPMDREPNVIWLLRELDDLTAAAERLKAAALAEYGDTIRSGDYVVPPLQSTTLERAT